MKYEIKYSLLTQPGALIVTIKNTIANLIIHGFGYSQAVTSDTSRYKHTRASLQYRALEREGGMAWSATCWAPPKALFGCHKPVVMLIRANS